MAKKSEDEIYDETMDVGAPVPRYGFKAIYYFVAATGDRDASCLESMERPYNQSGLFRGEIERAM